MRGREKQLTANKNKSEDKIIRLLLIIFLTLIASIVGYAVLSLPESATNLQGLVDNNIDISGVSNPVTAVLLNFRVYDTFLEMVVLLVALLGVWSIQEVPIESITDFKNPVLHTLVDLLVPFLILVSIYLLWVGAHAPGGAFQAGSVFGAGLVLLMLSGRQPFLNFKGFPLHFALIISVTLFIGISIYSIFATGELLKYPLSQASSIIFILEGMATVSIGLTLSLLFYGIYTKKKSKQ
jgi:multisubunit Na+/H+ antiporter MnhB subunit